MTSSASPSQELVEPLADLTAWTDRFRQAEIPVLRETVDSLDALRANRGSHRRQQHRRADRRRPAHDAEGACARVRASRPKRRHRAGHGDRRAGHDGDSAVLPHVRRTDRRRGPARGLRASARRNRTRAAARSSRRPLRTRLRGPSHRSARGDRPRGGAAARVRRDAALVPRAALGAADPRHAGRRSRPAIECRRSEACSASSSTIFSSRWWPRGSCPRCCRRVVTIRRSAAPARAASPSARSLPGTPRRDGTTPPFPDDIAEVAAFLNLSPAAALHLVREIDAD